MMIASGLYSQPTTIEVDRAQFVKMLSKAEKAKALEERLQIAVADISILTERIQQKEMIIETMKKKDTTNQNIIKSYDHEVMVMTDQRNILESEIKVLNRKIKWLRIKGYVDFGIGAVLGAAVAVIIK